MREEEETDFFGDDNSNSTSQQSYQSSQPYQSSQSSNSITQLPQQFDNPVFYDDRNDYIYDDNVGSFKNDTNIYNNSGSTCYSHTKDLSDIDEEDYYDIARRESEENYDDFVDETHYI